MGNALWSEGGWAGHILSVRGGGGQGMHFGLRRAAR